MDRPLRRGDRLFWLHVWRLIRRWRRQVASLFLELSGQLRERGADVRPHFEPARMGLG
jgi:hypothetical protein